MLAAAVIVLGVLMLLAAAPIGEAISKQRAEGAKRSSFLNQERREQVEQMYLSRGNEELQTGIVRGVGGVLVIGGVVALIKTLTT